MKRLFVDCDDTLILYGSEGEVHPYGFIKDEPYRVNEPLLAFIKAFREANPCALIVVWSGGGAQYALTIAREVGLADEVAVMIKDRTTFPLVTEHDIVIDDQPIKVAAVVTPPDFFDTKDNWGL